MAGASQYPHGEETAVVYARVPRSVRNALEKRRIRDRRTISGLVTIILEDWLRERGELPLREPVVQEV